MKIALHQITSKRAALHEDLAAYGEAGWTAFELHITKARNFVAQNGFHAYRKLVRGSGLTPVGCTGHMVRAFANDNCLRINKAEFTESLDYMDAIDCRIIIFGGDAPTEAPQTEDLTEDGLSARDTEYRSILEQFAVRIRSLAELAAERDITMALEMNWCSLCRSVATDRSRSVSRPHSIWPSQRHAEMAA